MCGLIVAASGSVVVVGGESPCDCSWRRGRYHRIALTHSEAPVVADLERHLGPRSVVADPDVVHGYAIDWSSRFQGSPACVVRARSRDEVVTVLERSASLGFPVVAQGGNTGLVGATMAPSGSVILNLSGLTGIVEEDDSSLVAGAGSTIASVQNAASRLGMVFGLDLASRDSATVGGAFNTNAGGIYGSYWGRMRDQVIGVEAVMADGTRRLVVSDYRLGVARECGIDATANASTESLADAARVAFGDAGGDRADAHPEIREFVIAIVIEKEPAKRVIGQKQQKQQRKI